MDEGVVTVVEQAPVANGGRSGIPVVTFTSEQVGLIKRTVANGATDDELALFLYTAKRVGLDPLAHQIHFVKRRSKDGPDKASFQTGIDGYRLIADRTGKYAGNDDPVFDDEANPRKATVTVYKIVDGQRCPFTATARWDQYYPGDKGGFMWNKMPHLMLGKCAEALALRKAFPAELSGVYTNEEMEQADRPIAEARPTIQQPKPKEDRKPESQESVDEFSTMSPDKATSKKVAKKDGSGTFEVYVLYAKDGWKGETLDKKVADLWKSLADGGNAADVQYRIGQYGAKVVAVQANEQPAGE